MDIYRHDDFIRKNGTRVIAGVDEAGRGPIAGPVVACAVILPEDLRIAGLRDSKKVPEKERGPLFWEVLAGALDVGVGVVDAAEIDRVNILRATKRAMEYALGDLRVSPDIIVIDALALPAISIKQISLIKADAKSACVAAASIVAKYVRDAMMLRYHDLYPQYNFRRHKGYGTKEHLRMIGLYGPCPVHRKSFCRVMNPELPLDG